MSHWGGCPLVLRYSRTPSPCIAERIAARTAELDALLADAEALVGPEKLPELEAVQLAWESYRDQSCALAASLKPRDSDPRQQFCVLRLTNARIGELREGEDFADHEAD